MWEQVWRKVCDAKPPQLGLESDARTFVIFSIFPTQCWCERTEPGFKARRTSIHLSLISHILSIPPKPQELVSEPGVRAMARSIYVEDGVVSTQPTASGDTHSSLDPWAK